MKPAIKICGIRTAEAFDCAVESGATHLGFVFYDKSPRYIQAEAAAELSARSNRATSVALTVDAPDNLLEHIAKTLNPGLWQLQGSEPVERVVSIRQRFGIPVMKALAIDSTVDVAIARKYEPIVDWLMFDAKPGELPGGNGLAFDWKIIANEKWSKPWLLSGGLTPENVAAAINQTRPPGIDVSSGVEKTRGTKDINLISTFISRANAAFSDQARAADQNKQ